MTWWERPPSCCTNSSVSNQPAMLCLGRVAFGAGRILAPDMTRLRPLPVLVLANSTKMAFSFSVDTVPV